MLLDAEKDRLIKENKILKKIVKLQDGIIHGSGNHIGLFNCYDTYYRGAWDKQLKKIKKLKRKS